MPTVRSTTQAGAPKGGTLPARVGLGAASSPAHPEPVRSRRLRRTIAPLAQSQLLPRFARRHWRERLRVAQLFGLALAGLLVVASCGGNRRPMKLELANRPAAGRPATCPDDAVDVFGDGTPSPMDARCSYDDAFGEGLSRVRGKVMGEGEPGDLPQPLAGVQVTMHRWEGGALGRLVAKATTDAQGTFTFSAILPAGEYVLVVGGAQRTVTLSGAGARVVDDLALVVPADPQLRPDR